MAVEALVVGGGLAGMLAVRALLGHVDKITVIERDRYPEQPQFRPGVPQARHLHNLIAGGQLALENLLPGIGAALSAAGAQRPLPSRDMVIHTATGWHRRFGFGGYATVSCTRPLLDHVVRTRVLADAAASRTRLELLERAEVTGLLGSAEQVTGVRLLERGGQLREQELAGDLVVDASGRGSHAPRWLEGLGLPAPAEDVVDAKLAYATRMFRFPTAPSDAVFLHSEPKLPRGGTLLPVEGGNWMLTLSGFAGVRPPTDEGTFLDYTAKLAHPHLHELMRTAESVSPVYGFLDTSNRRRRYHTRGASPEGFVVLGDASCAFNPVYGHGMAVAGLHAIALRDTLAKRGLSHGFTFAAQRAIARATSMPWRAATSADRVYTSKARSRVGTTDRLTGWFIERLTGHTAVNERIAEVVHGVFALALSPVRLLSPRVALRILLLSPGPGRSEPPEPLTGTRTGED